MKRCFNDKYLSYILFTGLVPIAIGRPAVDPVTGEISPIIAVRSNPENGMAIPITLSSGGPRKRKPPPGALTMLEEELVARRGYWRRQRQKEEEITTNEHQLTQKILFDMDSVTSSMIQRCIEDIDAGVHELSEAEKREVKRRGGEVQEYSTVLPPEVVAVLTENDAQEHEMEEAHVAQHVKFADMIRKFFNKLQQEENHYKDRVKELDGALNPDAENTALQRYKQARSRLQAELQDHIRIRTESLDEAHSSLEYARERSELAAAESKIVLTRSGLLAGDYDCQLSGVYGDADSSAESESELIPLLKQLIAMLESGGPFYLSSELLNLIQSGANAGSTTTNFNINSKDKSQDASGSQDGAGGSGKSDKDKDKRKREESKLVGHSVDTKTLQNTQTDDSTCIFGGPAGGKDGATQSEISKALFEKQAYEAAKLENNLKKEEINDINDTLDETEKRKQKLTDDAKRDLEKKLAKAKTEQEKEKLMIDYASQMQKLDEDFEKQKLKQLDTLRQKLLEKRRLRKKELNRKHISEAQQSGIPPDSVPQISQKSYDELMKDLLELQEQQERMLAEMRKSGETAGLDGLKVGIDPEYERQINALNITKSQKEDLINKAKNRRQELQKQIDEMKAKLAQRKDRNKASKLTDEELQGLTEAEKQKLMEARNMQGEADRMMEDQTVIDAMIEMEKVKYRERISISLIFCLLVLVLNLIFVGTCTSRFGLFLL